MGSFEFNLKGAAVIHLHKFKEVSRAGWVAS